MKWRGAARWRCPGKSLPARGGWIEIQIQKYSNNPKKSLPARGGWIEISIRIHTSRLKLSLPARGGWIEIGTARFPPADERRSLPARGGWIEISGSVRQQLNGISGPSPHGEGGLKSLRHLPQRRRNTSLPARGGWIEIVEKPFSFASAFVPPRTGRVD